MKDRLSKVGSQIAKDKWLIVFCFILAFLGWQGIRKNIGFKVNVASIGVEIEAPEGWAVWEKSAHVVNVEFNGSREDIRYLNNEQMRVVIPVEDPKHGEEMRIKLSKSHLRNPTGAKVISFSPAVIVVRLDQEDEQLLPVKASINGSLPEGLVIDRIVVDPASARISGARQVLGEMSNIHTEPIDLSNRQSSFKETVRIALPQAGRVLSDPEWVSVEIILEARDAVATFEKVPVRIMTAPGERRVFTVSPETINLTVKGQEQRIEQLRSADIFAYVNCHDLTENTAYELPPTVDLPAGIQTVKTEPAVVVVEASNE